MSQPSISLAIVNWNNLEFLRACLASLRREAAQVSLEIIVADNASSDHSVETLAPEFPEVIWISNPTNLGFAAATNQALRRARGGFWGVLNPDTEVRPGALARLLEELEKDPEIAVAGPKLLNSDLSLQPSGRRFPGLLRTAGESFLPRRLKQSAWWLKQTYGRADFSISARVEELSGACFVARREVFEKAGLFDEKFFLYFEEVDWFRRATALGFRAKYVPEAEVIHHWGGASRQVSEAAALYNAHSAVYYWGKHHGALGGFAMRLLIFKSACLRLAGRAILTFLGLKPWRDLGAVSGLQIKLMSFALFHKV